MKWKDIVADYLTFTYRDRIAVICLSVLIIFLFVLPRFINKSPKYEDIVPDTTWFSQVQKPKTTPQSESFPEVEKTSNYYSSENYNPPNPHNPLNPVNPGFPFDPNTLGREGWKKLGLNESLINTIENYRSKGGRFYKPGDLAKIYGMNQELYQRLERFIIITSQNTSRQTIKPVPVKCEIEINSADTSTYISLPGIGSKLASRIILFREKLGGFYSINQVGETYGLTDSVFQKIRGCLRLDPNFAIRKININKVGVEELKSHPYITAKLAQPIISYRNEHGEFVTIEEIRKVMAVTEEVFKKIAPYITLE